MDGGDGSIYAVEISVLVFSTALPERADLANTFYECLLHLKNLTCELFKTNTARLLSHFEMCKDE